MITAAFLNKPLLAIDSDQEEEQESFNPTNAKTERRQHLSSLVNEKIASCNNDSEALRKLAINGEIENKQFLPLIIKLFMYDNIQLVFNALQENLNDLKTVLTKQYSFKKSTSTLIFIAAYYASHMTSDNTDNEKTMQIILQSITLLDEETTLQILMEKNQDERTPLMYAALMGFDYCVSLIINMLSKISHYQAHQAIIVKDGVNNQSALDYATEGDNFKVLSIFLERFKEKVQNNEDKGTVAKIYRSLINNIIEDSTESETFSTVIKSLRSTYKNDKETIFNIMSDISLESEQPPLLRAVHLYDIEKVKIMLKFLKKTFQESDPSRLSFILNQRDIKFKTNILFHAITREDDELDSFAKNILKLLKDIFKNDYKSLAYLISDDNYSSSPLLGAMARGKRSIAEKFLNYLINHEQKDNATLLKILTMDAGGAPLFHCALATSSPAVVDLMIKGLTIANDGNQDALVEALTCCDNMGNSSVLVLAHLNLGFQFPYLIRILKNIINDDLKFFLTINKKNHEGFTPLTIATQPGQAAFLSIMIQAFLDAYTLHVPQMPREQFERITQMRPSLASTLSKLNPRPHGSCGKK